MTHQRSSDHGGGLEEPTLLLLRTRQALPTCLSGERCNLLWVRQEGALRKGVPIETDAGDKIGTRAEQRRVRFVDAVIFEPRPRGRHVRLMGAAILAPECRVGIVDAII